jgi:hypothetical protein
MLGIVGGLNLSGIATVQELKQSPCNHEIHDDCLKSPRKGPEGMKPCRILSGEYTSGPTPKLTMLGIVGGLNCKSGIATVEVGLACNHENPHDDCLNHRGRS